MATGVSVSASGTSVIDTTIHGTKWDSKALTYSFPSLASALSGYATVPNSSHVTGLSGAEQLAVKAALKAWSDVSGLTFSETGTASASDISIYWYLPPIVFDEYGNLVSGNQTAQVVDFPGSTQEAGDIQLGTYVVPGAIASWDVGNYPYAIILHEIGHALGLKHPHEEINGFPAAEADVDSIQLSVMSYRSYPGGEITGYTIPSGSFPVGLMPNDIAAIQYLYGANWSTNSGDTNYTFAPDAEVVLKTIWDGGGTDTYDFSNYTTNLSIDLTPGAWSDLGSQYAATEYMIEDDVVVPTSYFGGNLANPYLYSNDTRSLIENAKGGSGADTLIGNQADNMLTGGSGNDSITGGTGADTLIGGAGTDSLQGGDGNDVFSGSVGDMSGLSETIDGGDGTDTLLLTGSGTVDLTGVIVTDLEVIAMTQASSIQTVTLGSGQTGALTSIRGTKTGGGADDVVNVASGNLALSVQADILLLNLTAAGTVQTVTAGSGALLGVTVTGTGDDLITATGNLDLTGTTLTGIAELTFGSSGTASTLTLDTTTLPAGLPVNGFGAGDTITINGVTLSGTVSQGDGTAVAAHSVQFGTPSSGLTTLYIDTDGVADAAEMSLVLKGSHTPSSLISLGGSSIRHALPPPDNEGGGGENESSSPVSSTTTNGITSTTVSTIPVGTTTPVTVDLGTGNNTSLSASLPGGTSLNASGPQNPVAPTQLSQTVVAMVSTISADPTQQAVIGNAISSFVSTLAPTTTVAVRTITPTVVAGASPNTPISITGSAAGGEAVVLDTRGLPSGTVITVNNVDFLAVVGTVQLSGGDGSQSVICDGKAQIIVLGADDDVLHGGAGDDVVGSKGGDDQLYGDEGNDRLFGGAGNDTLDGGSGVDAVRVSGTRAQNLVTERGHAAVTITALQGLEGIDTLQGVEILRFDDGVTLANTPTTPVFRFEEGAYLARNPDVAAAVARGDLASGAEHFQRWGAGEGRGDVFVVDEAFYRAQNPDVDAAITAGQIQSAAEHFMRWGNREGRSASALFDPAWYLAGNPDVAAAVQAGQLTVYDHYSQFGWRENRDPSPWFDTSGYKDQHRDVAAADMNPLLHFLNYGAREGRLAPAADTGMWA